MNHDHDPLLRAVRDGDTACPDGAALAELGRRVRAASTPAREVDLVAGVLARLNAPATVTGADEAFGDEAIDAFYDTGNDGGNDDLLQLSELVRTACAPLHTSDLEQAVRARLKGSSLRLNSQRAVDLGGRFRVWSAVIIGHVAALLAITTWQADADATAPAQATDGTVATSPADASDPSLTAEVGTARGPHQRAATPPQAWSDLHRSRTDLFAPRRNAAAREQARVAAGLADTAPLVTGAVRWLLEQQDPTSGHFGLVAGSPERDLATQSLAVLALLGEGVDDADRATAVRLGLGWLDTHHGSASRDGVAASLAALALVEGAVLLNDEALRLRAAMSLTSIMPDQPGHAGLGGFAWLALQTAASTGIPVSGHALASAEALLGRTLPTNHDDPGRIGLAAYVRLVTGRHALASTSHLLGLLDRAPLRPRRDAADRIDPLGGLFATWAQRQADGRGWTIWARELAAVTTPAFTRLGDLAWVSAERVRFADAVPNGDVFATAVTVLSLQAPYRTLR